MSQDVVSDSSATQPHTGPQRVANAHTPKVCWPCTQCCNYLTSRRTKWKQSGDGEGWGDKEGTTGSESKADCTLRLKNALQLTAVLDGGKVKEEDGGKPSCFAFSKNVLLSELIVPMGMLCRVQADGPPYCTHLCHNCSCYYGIFIPTRAVVRGGGGG